MRFWPRFATLSAAQPLVQALERASLTPGLATRRLSSPAAQAITAPRSHKAIVESIDWRTASEMEKSQSGRPRHRAGNPAEIVALQP